jgi:hypothetical protein
MNMLTNKSRYSKGLLQTNDPQKLTYQSERPKRDSEFISGSGISKKKDKNSMTLDEWKGIVQPKSKKRKK